MLGQCFIFSESDNFRQSQHVVPLHGEKVFFGRKGVNNEYAYGTTYAEAGMALHMADDEMFLGAPGAWNWTGTMIA